MRGRGGWCGWSGGGDSGGGGGGSTYEEVNAFADLPAAADHSGEIYVVRTSTGVWLINRKQAGFYRSNGSAWSRLGDWLEAFNASNFKLYDNTDNTKQAAFVASNIATGTTRSYTLPDKNGTVAMLDDITGGGVDETLFYCLAFARPGGFR